jgi:twitching motility protein PilT
MEPLDTLRGLLAHAFANRATDVFLISGAPPRARIHDEIVGLAAEPVTPEMLDALASACGASSGFPTELDASWMAGDNLRCRVNLYRTLGRHAAVLRPIRSDIPPMESLGLPAHLLQPWMMRRNGLILITGPTGSGKSTTVAACIDWLNQNAARHIVTLEDPIEYLFTPVRCHISQREIGQDSTHFASALRAILRQSPDVIFLGEIRDTETAVTALQAAETGHLVISTLHCSSVVETLDRFAHLLADQSGLAAQMLANQLIGILTQQLLPRPDGGLFAALEYAQNEAATRKWILEHRHNDLLDHMHRGDGTTCVSHLTSLVHATQNGWIDPATARAACPRPADFDRAMRGIAH